MVECRTRDQEVPISNPGVGKKKNLSQVQSEQYHHQSLCTRLQYLKLSEVKTRYTHVTVVVCRTRDPEVPSSNPGVSKMNISHRSNQNNTTSNISAPEFNAWNCQRWKPEVTLSPWKSAGLEIQRSPVQTLEWAKRKSLIGPIRTIPPPIPLHQTSIPEIVRGENKIYPCHSGRVQD